MVKRPVPILLALLSATTLGGAWLAWRQYGELQELRAAALNRSERADLQRRIWDLEKQNRELQARADASRPGEPDAGRASTDPSGQRPAREAGGRGGPRGDPERGAQQLAAMRELMARPEVQRLINLQQRAGVESRYAGLFKQLNLSAEQAEKLSALLVERSNTRIDAFTAAREQGVDPRRSPDGFRQLLADVQTDLDASIKSLLGDTGFSQLQNYEQTMPQRALVNELQQRLSYTSAPLSSAQSEQLVQILASNPPARSGATGASATPPPPPPGRGPPGLGFPGMPEGIPGFDSAVRIAGAPVTDAAVTQAQSVLMPSQLSVLQQIQQQQKAQQQLDQVFRETLMPGPRGAPPASGTTPTTPGPVPRPPGK